MKSPFIQVCSIEFCISNHETDWYKGASYILIKELFLPLFIF